MTFAVAPPDYLPGPELAALAFSCDVLVVADTFQYVRQSLQNRARLRTPTGTQWITIPIRNGQHGRPICRVETDPRSDWRRTHLKAFRYNYGAAPFYDHYQPGLERVLEQDTTRLADITVASLRFVLEALRCPARVLCASALAGSPGRFTDVKKHFPGMVPVLLPGQVARDTGPEGTSLRMDLDLPTYRQSFDGFEPRCSAIDLLLMQGPSAANLIREGTRVRPARPSDVPSNPA